MIHKRQINAFTLVEVLISLFVLSIIFAVGYANYRDFARRKIIDAAANKFKSDILLARSYANASKKPETGCDALDGYTVFIDQTSETYSVAADCSNSDHVAIGKESINLGSNIDLKTNIDQFTFKVLGHGTNITSSSPVTIQIAPKTGYIYSTSIEITSGGEVIDRPITTLVSPTPTPPIGRLSPTPTPNPVSPSPIPSPRPR